MQSPIEELTKQILILQSKLDPQSKQYTQLTATTSELYSGMDRANGIDFLFRLLTVLQTTENSKYFEKIKVRKNVEEINLIILALIKNSLAKTHGIQIENKNTDNKKKNSVKNIALFTCIGLFGTLCAAVDGISIIQTILSAVIALSNIPSLILIPIQIIFAVIAVLTFYGFELSPISKTLGISILDLGKMYKIYGKQAQVYNETFSLIEGILMRPDLPVEKFEKLKKNYSSLTNACSHLDEKCKEALKIKQQPSRRKRALRTMFSVTQAAICGALAALGAQWCFASVLPLIIGATVAAGPIGLGITLGLMGVCFILTATLCYFVQEKAITKLVNKVFGTPQKAISELIDKDQAISRKKQKVENLIACKEKTYQLERDCSWLRAEKIQGNSSIKRDLAQMPSSKSFGSNPNRLQFTGDLKTSLGEGINERDNFDQSQRLRDSHWPGSY